MLKNPLDTVAAVSTQLAGIDRRWKSGIDVFTRTAAEFDPYGSHRPFKTIRTALYGDIYLEEDERYLVDSFFVQRLRNVSQLGLLHLVFPDARHSRFEHTLGVLWRTKQLLATKFMRNALSEFARTLRFAAILHDIGHGPFSHTAEKILKTLGVDRRLRRGDKYHEVRCHCMLTDADPEGRKDFQLDHLRLGTYGLRGFLDSARSPGDEVAKLINGVETPLTPIISGPVDMDKLDYFTRDAYYTGAPSGGVDPERLLSLYRWRDSRLGFDEKGIQTLLQFVYARHFTQAATIYHPVVRAVETMLIVAFDLALEILGDPEARWNILRHLELMDDSDLYGFIEITSMARPVRGQTRNHRLLRAILMGLKTRRLWKRLLTLSISQYCELLGRKSLDDAFEIYSEREVMWFNSGDFEFDFNEKDRRGFPIALALTPKPRSKHDIRTLLQSIKIFGAIGEHPLLDCCSGQAHLNGLLALQRDLWSVLVLGPEELRPLMGNSTRGIDRFRKMLSKVVRNPRNLRPYPEAYTGGMAVPDAG